MLFRSEEDGGEEEEEMMEEAVEEVVVGATCKHKYISIVLQILMQCRHRSMTLESEDKGEGSSTS